MRIQFDHANIDPDRVRPLIRRAFDRQDAAGRDVEVHVSRAEHRRVLWEVGCDGCGRPGNWVFGHRARTRKAARAACGNRAEPTKTVEDLPASVLFSGAAWSGLPARARVAPATRWLVTLKLPDPDVGGFPYEWIYHAAKTAIHPVIGSWDEALVYLAGHEARHVRQFIARLPQSEVDAEAGGMSALLDHRRRISDALRP